ncbi:helicase C-terminal domain-containing protein [Sphaerisporangium sp. TRM90804]|uniref:helicase C-terminal domain-containing protein n=1 Tax=Sphaerisporangium sp. TRM90804 TaxID=3031113 RepID=UPI0024487280|nr:helicase C-terminal domain-containing protein [Sphaerisporangium sp. TRM90804]MDH2430408.1 helicase C-terminal domain-containing protein [Sphaerisporangium sp. TRM90804]
MTNAEFTEWLRDLSDTGLRALVAARPELITPVPAHIEGLAIRAASPSVTGRALDRLNRFTLAVVETLVVMTAEDGPGLPYDELHRALARSVPSQDASPPRPAEASAPRPSRKAPSRDVAAGLGTPLREAVDHLRAAALIYGPDDALRPAPGVREVSEHPAGLGPPAAEVFRHHPPERLEELAEAVHRGQTARGGSVVDRLAGLLAEGGIVERLLRDVGPQARAALEELAWGPPTGRVPNARRQVTLETAQSPIEQLLARGLLAANSDDSVVLPREVGLVLRGGRVHRDLCPTPPPLTGTARDAELAGRTAASQAFAFTRTVEELCERWSVDPPGTLRAGGLSVRDLKRTAQILDLPEWTAALVVEVAHAAGLVAATSPADGEWVPTTAYDGWRVKATEDRWEALAGAWLAGDRVPGLVGERDDRDRLLNVLHPELRRPAAAEVRLRTLAVLASAGPGLAPSSQSVRERLAFEQPRRRGAYRDQLVEFTLREAEQIGVIGLGAMPAFGRRLLPASARQAPAPAKPAGKGAARKSAAGTAAELLAPLLPEPLDHLLLQADLTAVAPGPLVSELGRWLALVADIESKGVATVYRFGEQSVRRALDAGFSAEDVLAMLEKHSTTPVPQPLRYLVTDVARRHGRVRVGTAGAYVRCDDPGVLDEVMADKRAVPLRLRRLAPTVVASRSSRVVVVDSLRALGYAPVAESSEGDVVVSRADARRTERPPSARSFQVHSGPDTDVVAAAVRALRAGDAAHQERRQPVAAPDGQVPRSPSTGTITVLQEAIRQGARVWIGYLDSQGHATSRILEPARMEGGYLTAYDETRAAIHRFALHRITGVADVG